MKLLTFIAGLALIAGIVLAETYQTKVPVLVDPATDELAEPTAAELASANSLLQTSNSTYTSAVAKANSALQPNAVAKTNIIISADAKTNTLIVIGGQITSWTVGQ